MITALRQNLGDDVVISLFRREIVVEKVTEDDSVRSPEGSEA